MTTYEEGLLFDTYALVTRVRTALAERGMSQREGAAKMGLALSTLNRFLCTQSGPDAITLTRILHWLDGPKSPLAGYETTDRNRASQALRSRSGDAPVLRSPAKISMRSRPQA